MGIHTPTPSNKLGSTPSTTLVYGTTLFDSFLTDTARFLYLLHPLSVGKDVQVSLGELVNYGSLNEAIEAIANKKVFELGYKSFQDRIEVLKKRFKLSFSLTVDERKELIRITELRNNAIHNQSPFQIRLREAGRLEVETTGSVSHPTNIEENDLEKASNLYYGVMLRMVESVLRDVLKTEAEISSNILETLKKAA